MWLGWQNKKPIPPVVKGRVYARGSTQDSEIAKYNYFTLVAYNGANRLLLLVKHVPNRSSKVVQI
ncbi:hypothetical protein A7N88_03950 [Listeria monocytogenes]|nr:hypothetical protein [Listeria monocytogenes]EAG9491849.1 hypothetical protein [Listeria monocytogenes]PCW76350.1 hypothetical protein A7N88_03950 [Listeria monocytogenes]PCX94547.1 hypothetical protein A7N90_06065 [Listeria monocytogenes]PCX96891.1 hypothetical protein A7N89_07160 [Listeria monocytogenes]